MSSSFFYFEEWTMQTLGAAVLFNSGSSQENPKLVFRIPFGKSKHIHIAAPSTSQSCFGSAAALKKSLRLRQGGVAVG